MSEDSKPVQGQVTRFLDAMPAWAVAVVGIFVGSIVGVVGAIVVVSNFAQVPVGELVGRAADAQFRSVDADLTHREREREAQARERQDALSLMMTLLQQQQAANTKLQEGMAAQAGALAGMPEALDSLRALPGTVQALAGRVSATEQDVRALRHDVDGLLRAHPKLTVGE